MKFYALFSEIADFGYTGLQTGSYMAFLKTVIDGLVKKGFASAIQFSEVRISCSFILLYVVDLSHHAIHFYRQTFPTQST